MACARVVRGTNSTEKVVAAGGGNFLDNFFRPQRPQESNQNLAAPQQRKVCCSGEIVRAKTQYLNDNIGCAEYGRAVGEDLRALFDIGRIQETRRSHPRPLRLRLPSQP